MIEAKIKEAFNTGKVKKGTSIMVEDTSLYLKGLTGKDKHGKEGTLPGPLIKFFNDTIGNDGLVRLAKAFKSDKAEAATFIGYAANEQSPVQFFMGVTEGRIVEPRGKGFGWDPVFEVTEEGSYKNKTFAELTTEEKNKVSMRGRAAQQLRDTLYPPVFEPGSARDNNSSKYDQVHGNLESMPVSVDDTSSSKYDRHGNQAVANRLDGYVKRQVDRLNKKIEAELAIKKAPITKLGLKKG